MFRGTQKWFDISAINIHILQAGSVNILGQK